TALSTQQKEKGRWRQASTGPYYFKALLLAGLHPVDVLGGLHVFRVGGHRGQVLELDAQLLLDRGQPPARLLELLLPERDGHQRPVARRQRGLRVDRLLPRRARAVEVALLHVDRRPEGVEERIAADGLVELVHRGDHLVVLLRQEERV